MPIQNWRDLKHGDLLNLNLPDGSKGWVKVVDVMGTNVWYRYTNEEEVKTITVGLLIDNSDDAF